MKHGITPTGTILNESYTKQKKTITPILFLQTKVIWKKTRSILKGIINKKKVNKYSRDSN